MSAAKYLFFFLKEKVEFEKQRILFYLNYQRVEMLFFLKIIFQRKNSAFDKTSIFFQSERTHFKDYLWLISPARLWNICFVWKAKSSNRMLTLCYTCWGSKVSVFSFFIPKISFQSSSLNAFINFKWQHTLCVFLSHRWNSEIRNLFSRKQFLKAMLQNNYYCFLHNGIWNLFILLIATFDVSTLLKLDSTSKLLLNAYSSKDVLKSLKACVDKTSKYFLPNRISLKIDQCNFTPKLSTQSWYNNTL